MEQYLYAMIIAGSIFLCPMCFLNFEIHILPKLRNCFKKKNNINELNEKLIDN